MSSFNTLAKGVFSLGLGLTASACATTPELSAPMAIGPQAPAPRGFVEFCERLPTDCGATPAELSALREDAARRQAAIQTASLRFDWTGVFAGVTESRPTAAVAAPAVLPGATVAVRYDWSQVFARQLQVQAAVGEATPVAARAEEAPVPAERLELTPKLWTQINRANDQVNRAIAQKTDLEAYGVEEVWNMPIEAGGRYGDCEDYVLEKRRALIAAGLPREALSIAVVQTSKGDSHAVLLVDTQSGEYVLDNLTPWVLPWTRTAYRWRERQVAGSPARWAMAAGVKLEPTASGLLLASLR